MIDPVGLDTGVIFAQSPDDFIAALCDDIVAKRVAAAGGSG
ncbi:MAG: hypothetical protein QG597_2418 [Actinomycetota bacterium]|nr:hypothetical protein [Actinomycetota bacterium]